MSPARRPHRVDLGELAVRDLADAGAAVRLGDDEPQRLELAERLAHRRLAHAELVGDLHLHDALPGRVLALQDPREEKLLDLVAQHGAGQRHGAQTSRTRGLTLDYR
jgi:hypothetical protein